MTEYIVWSSSLRGAHIACASKPEIAIARVLARYGNPGGAVLSCLETDPPFWTHDDCGGDHCKRQQWIGTTARAYFTVRRQINHAVLRGAPIHHE